MPVLKDSNVLVGTATGDDAGVYRLDAKRALVQTTDFFTPIVDDPYWYGQIAATNALSDVYAMGGRPLTALNLVGIPADVVPLEVVNEIVRGGAEKILQAKCVLIGGHTIKIPEPVFGYAVTGMVSPQQDADQRERASRGLAHPYQADRHRHHHHGNQTRPNDAGA